MSSQAIHSILKNTCLCDEVDNRFDNQFDILEAIYFNFLVIIKGSPVCNF